MRPQRQPRQYGPALPPAMRPQRQPRQPRPAGIAQRRRRAIPGQASVNR